MISSGVLTLVGLAGLVLAFAVVSAHRGSAIALVLFCWVPLVAVILVLASHQRLGYAGLGLLVALLFGLVVIATAIPTWILHACE